MTHLQSHFLTSLCVLFVCFLTACQPLLAEPIHTPAPLPTGLPATETPTAVLSSPTATSAPPQPTATIASTETAVPPTPTATPFFSGVASPPCGQKLPLLPSSDSQPVQAIFPDESALLELKGMMPDAAQPALDYIVTNPQNIGLVVYRLGEIDSGVFLNPDVPMPLASVAKLIILVAYVEAVETGELDPAQQVSLQTLDQFYLPNSDLGAHALALADLEEQGRINPATQSVSLNDVAWMMIRHSSNAASDYLHRLLGQARIEETAVWLNLTQQTAPCPFLGQFLAMANHTRSGNGLTAVNAYLENPSHYGQEASLFADAFSQAPHFRQAELEWRNGRRAPSLAVQKLFSETLNAQGTAREYAALMGRFSQNGLGNGESSFRARLILEWPMRVFPDNQFIFDNLGYKNGSLPGILTTAYYAYQKGSTTPVVVTLFFRNLDMETYRQWRFRSLPHDEFARWLLAEPRAIPQLRDALNQ